MKSLIAFLIFLGIGIFYALAPIQNTEPWEVPISYEQRVNPIEGDKASLKIGKKLYNKHCKSCHGKEGLGDGSKAAQLDTPMRSFDSEGFLSQSQGAIFYKSWIGRDEMPSFEKKIPDQDDMWCIVNYICEF